jgi:hypothetical protein
VFAIRARDLSIESVGPGVAEFSRHDERLLQQCGKAHLGEGHGGRRRLREVADQFIGLIR